ncbi:MAG: ATP-dependent Clp protease adapter ClpS [Clostridia bacterium]|nr:ATP-dependent Clp protease adapter ClpS [Clostridia bacterium]
MSERTIFKEEIKTVLKKPKMYRVILLNDDYTTMDFVVEVLVHVFHKSAAEATKIMLDVHEKGKGIVGIYTYDIAATKIAQVEDLATKREFPLKAIMEEE